MLTGDKGETAHNIAISCGLFDPTRHTVYEMKEIEQAGIDKEIGFIESKVSKKPTTEFSKQTFNPSINSAQVQSASGIKQADQLGELEMVDLKIGK